MTDKGDTIIYPDFSLEKMSSQELEDILRHHAFSDGEIDAEQVQRILRELERREPQAAISSPEAAWEQFKTDYSGRNSIYLDCAHKDSVSLGETSKQSARRSRPLFKAALAAAIAAVLLMGATITAAAFGYDLWGIVATWTKETFGFVAVESAPQNNDERSPSQVHPELAELQAALNEHGIGAKLLPSYLPKGFAADESSFAHAEEKDFYFVSLVNGDKYIGVLIHTLERSGGLFQKDEEDPILYDVGGIRHYIFMNNDKYCAAWVNGGYECGINGFDTEDEIRKVIDSIYEQ